MLWFIVIMSITIICLDIVEIINDEEVVVVMLGNLMIFTILFMFIWVGI